MPLEKYFSSGFRLYLPYGIKRFQQKRLMTRDFTYTTRKNNTLSITVYGIEKWGQQPCVLYVHGFKGFKDWGFVPYIGEKFAQKNICFVTFNFSHNGIGNEKEAFSEFEKFANNTFSLELSELREMINLCTGKNLFGDFHDVPIGILGHSRGGGISILASVDNPNVAALVTWASVCTFERYEKSVRAEWRNKGYIEVPNLRTGQIFKLNTTLLEDVEKNGKTSLNILASVKDLHKPLLIIHGDKDTTVPFFEAEQLNVYAFPNTTQYYLLANADHTFGAVHPFIGTTPYLEDILERSIAFFQKNL